ncbi:Uma2 family endonuclease [Phormidium sp. FACHB-1136]|uniref:Uma2 family endonuclease n=1 Tax=Phormidium sp. FACHB-1136 TaxID=2692848 RepID=UPI0016865E07|nr:Uma2 family endonuclease [Phormidium sp. FACHB-1136]MBD2426912.1 Uma2 family endonuclease [Phormidium sp. FACHB-1136]
MVQLQPKLLTVRDFIDHYGDNPQYELIGGELTNVEPTGIHEQVAGFVGRKLNVAIDQQNAPYVIPYRCLIKLLGTETAFRPDVVVLDQAQLAQEPLWQQEPVICRGASIKLVVEVVSTNWQNDYARKTEDYALLGVPEYWIVGYLGLGGRDYIGTPKQPTVTLCVLEGDRYQKQVLHGDDLLRSPTFPSLSLTVRQICMASQ